MSLDKLRGQRFIKLGRIDFARYSLAIPPMPKDRARFSGSGQPYKTQKSRIYEQAIGAAAHSQHQMLAPWSVRLFATSRFYTNNEKADIDNLEKSFFDGLQIGKVIKNDNLIDASFSRRYPVGPEDKERAEIILRPMTSAGWLLDKLETLLDLEKQPTTCPFCCCDLECLPF